MSSALDQGGISRRDFLKTSGALIVGFSILGTQGNSVEAQDFDGGSPGSPSAAQVDSWIAVAADGKVTAYSGKAELGQGMSMAQTQLRSPSRAPAARIHRLLSPASCL